MTMTSKEYCLLYSDVRRFSRLWDSLAECARISVKSGNQSITTHNSIAGKNGRLPGHGLGVLGPIQVLRNYAVGGGGKIPGTKTLCNI